MIADTKNSARGWALIASSGIISTGYLRPTVIRWRFLKSERNVTTSAPSIIKPGIASCPGRVFLPGSSWGERFVPETGFNFLETRQARIGKEDLNGYLHIFTPFP